MQAPEFTAVTVTYHREPRDFEEILARLTQLDPLMVVIGCADMRQIRPASPESLRSIQAPSLLC